MVGVNLPAVVTATARALATARQRLKWRAGLCVADVCTYIGIAYAPIAATAGAIADAGLNDAKRYPR